MNTAQVIPFQFEAQQRLTLTGIACNFRASP